MRTFLKTLALSLAFISPLGFASPVNINTASAEQISDALRGIGPAKAQAIVQYREQKGAFTSVEQLAEVKGIGSATLEKNRDQIVIEAAEGEH
ncbi:DNA uptake protein and related DNA-binding protein [Marinobacterium lacunae]|uniref:DNA uptake protein and related DNA-binding protein n=1 Tax=Marinobacterium lacunae TaxID=1232683 RepID=A0A081G3R8_9GAMM|nr:ComEA family DNA-binding protein [Marinobacterium lacunae]KEA65423.1 DNA uptake protein and related DNA-binding protein [Marinobacterium lacunae]MBR9884680.1 helix-hairpin-helix domain-containing protein [Oceanospirillales bacterium]